MNREDILKAFAGLSPEDQDAIRKEFAKQETPSESADCCGSGGMGEHMTAMMQMFLSGEQPMERCQDMMGACREMMAAKAGQAEQV